MSFIYLKRDCPICGGARKDKDCRKNTTTGLIHCRYPEANPIGWHAVKEDAQGFMMWAEGDSKSSVSSEEWQQRKIEQQIERRRREEEKRRGALPVPERDAAIRKLARHFGLSPAHRANLRSRGLTDEEIDKHSFFSIQPGERVPPGIPENLPGVRNGRISGKEGYACLAFNPDGQITGYQIRLDNPEDGGKYRWAYGSKSSHLPNGELPITYVRPLDGEIKGKRIGICEGMQKAVIAAQKLKQIFIAASSLLLSKDGEIDGKPAKIAYEQFLEYLEARSRESGTKQVVLYPDGGVVKNWEMYQKYQWTWDALVKLGYDVKIAWWGQIDKDAPDCDELPENQEIKLIKPGTFADYAKRFGGASPAWMHEARKEWRKNRKFTPDFVTCEKFVSWEKPADGTIFFGRAAMGGGKTTRLKSWVKQWKAEGQRRFYVLGYRNTLLLQTASQLGFMHIHDEQSQLLRADEDTSFCLCVDSLRKIPQEDFEGSIILLDEIMSVIKHLLHSATIPSHRRDEILRLFEGAIRSARILICMDGLMADWAVEYLSAIAPDKKIIRVQNKGGEKLTINVLTGTVGIDEKIKPNDRSPLVSMMLQSSLPVVCSDSQIFLEAMDEVFQTNGAKTLRIDSKTIPEDYTKEFLANGNEYLKNHDIDVLLYSPSAESGLDISLKNRFTHQFCFFFGVLGVDGILQMVGRVRDANIQRFVWCKDWVASSEQEHTKSPHVEKVKKAMAWIAQKRIEEFVKQNKFTGEFPDELLQTIASQCTEALKQSYDVHFHASCLISANKNAEGADLRSLTIEAFLAEGHKICEFTASPDPEAKDIEKDSKESLKRRNAADIYNAPLAEEEIAELAKATLQYDARWDERCRRIKAKYLHRLPDIQHSKAWDEEFIYHLQYEEPNFLARQELFWLHEHPEEAAKENARTLHRLAKVEKIFIGNIRSRFLKVGGYHQLGIDKFFNLDATWTDDSPEIQELLERCKNFEIAKILGHPGKMKGIQNLTRLLKPLGIFLRLSDKTKTERFYRLDTEQFFDPDRLATLAAIEIRYEQAKSEEKAIDWNDVCQPAMLSNESPLEQEPEGAETTQNGGTSPLNVLTLYREGATNSSENSVDDFESEKAPCDNSGILERMPEKSEISFVILRVDGKDIKIPIIRPAKKTEEVTPAIAPVKENIDTSILVPEQAESLGTDYLSVLAAGSDASLHHEFGIMARAFTPQQLCAVISHCPPATWINIQGRLPEELKEKAIAATTSTMLRRDSATTSIATKPPAAPPAVSEKGIRVGSRVRYLGKGSKRHGMIGTIKSINGSIASLWLDYYKDLRHDWRDLGASLSQLELVE
jgi:hypothetical protein